MLNQRKSEITALPILERYALIPLPYLAQHPPCVYPCLQPSRQPQPPPQEPQQQQQQVFDFAAFSYNPNANPSPPISDSCTTPNITAATTTNDSNNTAKTVGSSCSPLFPSSQQLHPWDGGCGDDQVVNGREEGDDQQQRCRRKWRVPMTGTMGELNSAGAGTRMKSVESAQGLGRQAVRWRGLLMSA